MIHRISATPEVNRLEAVQQHLKFSRITCLSLSIRQLAKQQRSQGRVADFRREGDRILLVLITKAARTVDDCSRRPASRAL